MFTRQCMNYETYHYKRNHVVHNEDGETENKNNSLRDALNTVVPRQFVEKYMVCEFIIKLRHDNAHVGIRLRLSHGKR